MIISLRVLHLLLHLLFLFLFSVALPVVQQQQPWQQQFNPHTSCPTKLRNGGVRLVLGAWQGAGGEVGGVNANETKRQTSGQFNAYLHLTAAGEEKKIN